MSQSGTDPGNDMPSHRSDRQNRCNLTEVELPYVSAISPLPGHYGLLNANSFHQTLGFDSFRCLICLFHEIAFPDRARRLHSHSRSAIVWLKNSISSFAWNLCNLRLVSKYLARISAECEVAIGLQRMIRLD
jgi:hypothetical protein